jgi:hypothetical protein
MIQRKLKEEYNLKKQPRVTRDDFLKAKGEGETTGAAGDEITDTKIDEKFEPFYEGGSTPERHDS